VLVQVEEFLYQENLAVEWASIPSESSAEPFAVKNATGFHRLWSALNFLFCIVDGAGETAVSAGGGEVPASATLISNEAEFGHGFTIAGCALLHLLGQRATFDVLDFSAHVLQLDAHERRVTEAAAAAPAAKLDESLLRETTAFIYSARTQRLLQQQLFALLEVLHKTRDSYTKHSTNSMVFHPPAEAL
jgi:cytoplasmic FMR1 interacting protein